MIVHCTGERGRLQPVGERRTPQCQSYNRPAIAHYHAQPFAGGRVRGETPPHGVPTLVVTRVRWPTSRVIGLVNRFYHPLLDYRVARIYDSLGGIARKFWATTRMSPKSRATTSRLRQRRWCADACFEGVVGFAILFAGAAANGQSPPSDLTMLPAHSPKAGSDPTAMRQTPEPQPIVPTARTLAVALPNSDHNLRCVVNLSGHAVKYPAESWATAPLTTDLSVRHNTVPDARVRFEEVVKLLRRTNPHAFVGRYISGGRVESEIKQYPQEAIRSSEFPNKWLRTATNRVDLSNAEAADLFADLIIAESIKPASQIVFLDNIVHPSTLSGWVPWEDTCRFLQRVKRGVNKNASLLIANIAVAPWGMPDQEGKLLSNAVDGMSFEMPFHRHARENRKRTRSLIAVYRKWLSAGKLVVFIPLAHAIKTVPEVDRESETIREMRLLAGFAMLIRNPGDRLFVASPFWRPEPDWAHWPESFGSPREEWYFEADHVLVRRFENYTLKVDVRSKTVSRILPQVSRP